MIVPPFLTCDPTGLLHGLEGIGRSGDATVPGKDLTLKNHRLGH
jgi:hypothetical protein